MSSKKKLEPLISIITVVLNNEKYIEETILSVLNQSYKNIEYIIIDGSSTDQTIEIVNKYKDKISKIISEPDKGIYDAFNKGYKFSNGEYIGVVNSDDILMPNALEYLIKYHRKFDFDFFFGSVKKHYGVLHGFKPWKIFFSWGFYSSHSTGFYITKKAANLVGEYNLKYKLSSDFDFFYRMIVKKKLKGMSSKKGELFGIFRRGGFSSKVNYFDHLCEVTRIRLDNKQNKLLVLVIFIIKFIRNIKKI